MTVLIVVLAVLAVVVVVFFVGGLLGARRRYDVGGEDWRRHVAEADSALEEARAADRGWDRAHLERAARVALERERPGQTYDSLHVVLVDDRPGVEEDRAEMMAVAAEGGAHLRLARRASGWEVESVD